MRAQPFIPSVPKFTVPPRNSELSRRFTNSSPYCPPSPLPPPTLCAPPRATIDVDVPRRRITRNFRRDRFHGLPETFESLETPKPGGNAPSVPTIEAWREKIPVEALGAACCWKKTRRSRRREEEGEEGRNRSGRGEIAGGKVSLNNYAA